MPKKSDGKNSRAKGAKKNSATKAAKKKTVSLKAEAGKKEVRRLDGQLFWISKHARILTLLSGSAIVSLWTLIRHITNGVNFDVVGQIGVAQQWAQGQMSGTQLGATSYLLKIPFYFGVNALHFLTPMNRILVMALLFNIATFVLLFILFERTLKLYDAKRSSWLYLGMAWLATIAGNVFWVDYANSRNLETVGGIFFIYLVLRYLRLNRRQLILWLALAGAVVFFADPIQFYICGIGASLFVLVRWLLRRNRSNAVQAVSVVSATIAGYVLSVGLLQLSKHILRVSFLVTPNNHTALNASNLGATLQAVGTNTLKIFGADFYKRPYTFNSGRELLNALVLLALAAAIIKILSKSYKKTVVGLLSALIVTNYLVYIASGQALEWQTSRYLIMVPLFVVLLLAVRGNSLKSKYTRQVRYTWLSVIVICSVMLVGALVNSWPDRHSKDNHIYALLSFMSQHDYKYALSSRDAGITTTYFSGGETTVLPMSCQPNGKIHPTNLFYDNAAFNGLSRYHKDAPVIVPDGGIKFGANTCTQANVIAQFGQPKQELPITGFGSALIYNADNLRLIGFEDAKAVLKSPRPPAIQPPSLPRLSGCSQGSLEVIVAHPDDDLLFMNPDLANEIPNRCVRTVYVTAGDDGRSQAYWKRRQSGIEAAYAAMIGLPNVWGDKRVILDSHNILIRTLNGYPAASLIFLFLPDGSTNGNGFADTNFLSIEKMSTNKQVVVPAIDGSSSYSYSDLAKVLSTIISVDKPDRIFTTLSGGHLSVGDHSDHRQVGRLVQNAKTLAKSHAILTEYVGYPSNGLPANLTTQETAQKKAIFDIYATQDGAICIATNNCLIDNTYGNYFSRMYKFDQNQYNLNSNNPVLQSAAPA